MHLDDLQSRVMKHYWLLVGADLLEMDGSEALNALEKYENCSLSLLFQNCHIFSMFS